MMTVINNHVQFSALKTTYHVHVYTGDKFGAGTDANVFITLFGEIDDTGESIHRDSMLNCRFHSMLYCLYCIIMEESQV